MKAVAVALVKTYIRHWHAKEPFALIVYLREGLAFFELLVNPTNFVGDFVSPENFVVSSETSDDHLYFGKMSMRGENV